MTTLNEAIEKAAERIGDAAGKSVLWKISLSDEIQPAVDAKINRLGGEYIEAVHDMSIKHDAELAKKDAEIERLKAEMLNNPFCLSCNEPDCIVSLDGTCAMMRRTEALRDSHGKLLEALHKSLEEREGYRIQGGAEEQFSTQMDEDVKLIAAAKEIQI